MWWLRSLACYLINFLIGNVNPSLEWLVLVLWTHATLGQPSGPAPGYVRRPYGRAVEFECLLYLLSGTRMCLHTRPLSAQLIINSSIKHVHTTAGIVGTVSGT